MSAGGGVVGGGSVPGTHRSRINRQNGVQGDGRVVVKGFPSLIPYAVSPNTLSWFYRGRDRLPEPNPVTPYGFPPLVL